MGIVQARTLPQALCCNRVQTLGNRVLTGPLATCSSPNTLATGGGVCRIVALRPDSLKKTLPDEAEISGASPLLATKHCRLTAGRPTEVSLGSSPSSAFLSAMRCHKLRFVRHLPESNYLSLSVLRVMGQPAATW